MTLICLDYLQLIHADWVYNKKIKLLMMAGWHGHADQVLLLSVKKKKKTGCTAWVVDQ